jgi:hypothetical protein
MSAKVEPFLVNRNWYTFEFTYDGTLANDTVSEQEARGITSALRGLAGRESGSRAIAARNPRPDGVD